MKGQTVKISLFHCSNSLSADDVARFASQLENTEINSISLPCSGKVNLQYIMKSIETGSDAAILTGCKTGECKFLQGNLRAQKRIEAVSDLLEETGVGKEVVKFIQFNDNDGPEQIFNEIKNFCKQLKKELQTIKELD